MILIDFDFQANVDKELSELQISVDTPAIQTDHAYVNSNTPGSYINAHMAANCDFAVDTTNDMASSVDFSSQGQISAAVHVQGTQAYTSWSHTVLCPSMLGPSMTIQRSYVPDYDDLSQCIPASFLSTQCNFGQWLHKGPDEISAIVQNIQWLS